MRNISDRLGESYRVPLDSISDEATYVFGNGQCLAYAVAVSRLSRQASVHVLFQHCPSEQDPTRVFQVVHVYGCQDDDRIADVQGALTTDDAWALHREYDYAGKKLYAKTMPISSAQQLFHPQMVTQDYETATTLAPLYLERELATLNT